MTRVLSPDVTKHKLQNDDYKRHYALDEVLHSQLMDIMAWLNTSSVGSKWSYIGVGRDDGKEAGEYSPIIYRKSVWQVVEWRTVWLSETPDKPSKGWDAASTRIVTVGVFEHRDSRQSVLAMSTHFDDQGVKSRQESAKLIIDIIQKEANTKGFAAVLLGGDFNSPPDDAAYQIMTDSDSPMEDIGLLVPKEGRYGNELTFTSFGHVDNTPSRIDFIFARKGDHVSYLTYAVLANRFDDGVYSSDHRACVADLRIRY
ncbi:DNase I-like protein [Glarea lozoyensis ATCC 20868]|uniref:DNase I-like protein n=1 Tax=Glarea lozoyensis (strain ATCC 20868 / MF5171) TaxID=1116229 RepID=S3D397_GLAL2|nr:DNase I-like protein [Glarea lozoyensis ATCC 20868]EPE32967.1 DNase I-like protein [Glarea lozoyensis ATCC 20868]